MFDVYHSYQETSASSLLGSWLISLWKSKKTGQLNLEIYLVLKAYELIRYPTLISESLGDRLGKEHMHLYWRDFHNGLQAGKSIFRSFAIPRCYNLTQGTLPSHIFTLTCILCQNVFFHRKALLEIELTTPTSTSTQSSDSPIASASTNSTFSTTSTPDLSLIFDDTNP